MAPEEEDRSHIELAYASFAVFADDGKIDEDELAFLLTLALRDGVVTEAEKNVLRGVFNRMLEGDVSAKVWSKVQSLREEHGI